MFNPDKVQFTEEELEAAASLDVVIEALLDGIDFSDFTAIAGQVMPLYNYLKGDDEFVDKREIAEKIAYLLVALERDNDWV